MTRNGNGRREAGDEVDDGTRPLEVVEQLVGDALDGRLERSDARRRERPGDEPAQAGVVGRIDGEHVPGERRAGQPLVDDVGIGVHRREHVLGQAGVHERLAGGVVADDEPGVVAVAQADVVHRAPLAHRLEVRVRVVLDVVGPRRPRSAAPQLGS